MTSTVRLMIIAGLMGVLCAYDAIWGACLSIALWGGALACMPRPQKEAARPKRTPLGRSEFVPWLRATGTFAAVVAILGLFFQLAGPVLALIVFAPLFGTTALMIESAIANIHPARPRDL